MPNVTKTVSFTSKKLSVKFIQIQLFYRLSVALCLSVLVAKEPGYLY